MPTEPEAPDLAGATKEVRMPKFGMSAVDAEILELLVGPGDEVAPGQAVAEAASDKVDFTIEAEQAGTVVELFVSTGQNVSMGDLVARLE